MPTISIAHKILRNTTWNIFSRLLHIPVSICLIPFIMDRVGTNWYGIWVTLFALVDYFTLLDLGVGAATIRHVAEYHASHDVHKIGRVAVTTCGYNLLFLPPLIAAYVCTDNILNFFHIAPHEMEEARFLFHWVLFNFALSQFTSVFRNILIGLQQIHVINRCEILYLFAYAGGTVAVLSGGAGLKGLVVMLFFLRFGLAAAQFLCVLRSVPIRVQGGWVIDGALLKDFIRYGLKLQLASLVGLLNFQLDKLLIGHLLKIEFVAFYDLGSKLASMSRTIPSALMSPVVPAAAELVVQRDNARLRELYLRGTRYLSLMAAPLTAFLLAMGSPILTLWLGNHVHAYAVLALQFLAIGYYFNIITGVVNSLGRGMGVLKYELQTSALIIILNLILSLALILHMGFVGALIGTCVAMTIGNLLYLYRFNQYLEIPAYTLLRQVFFKPAGAAVIAGGALYIAQFMAVDFLGPETMSRPELALYLCTAGIAFFCVFCASLMLLRCIDRSDVELASRLWAAVRMV